MWRVSADGLVEQLDPWLWIADIEDQHWFNEGMRAEWHQSGPRAAAIACLQKYRITGVPRFAEVLPIMCRHNFDTIQSAVEAMAPAARAA